MRLASACLVAAVAAGCAGCRSGPSRIDPALARWIPPETVLLAGAQVEPLRGYLQGRLPLPGDASEVLLVSNGADTAILARGNFAGSKRADLTILDSTTAAAGSLAAIQETRGRSSGVPAALREGLHAIPPEHQVWIVAAGGLTALEPFIPKTGNASNLRKLLAFVESLTASTDLRSGLNGFAAAKCRTAEDARSLADAVRGFSLLAGYRDAVKVTVQERDVRVEVVTPASP